MTDAKTVQLDGNGLLAALTRNFELGNADVFAFGRADSISRLGELAAYLSMIGDAAGEPRAESVKIVLPPPGGRDRQAMLDDLKRGMQRACRKVEPNDAEAARLVEGTFARVEVEGADDFSAASLEALLARARPRQALIVGEAAHYRSDAVAPPPDDLRLPEDVWCGHLHAAMLMAEDRARASECYVLLDIGQQLPSRESNVEFLKTAGDVGLCGVSPDDELSPEEILGLVSAAYDAAAAGELGKAFSLIDRDDRLSDGRKWIMRLAVLERAGARDEASRILDDRATSSRRWATETCSGSPGSPPASAATTMRSTSSSARCRAWWAWKIWRTR